MNRATPLTSSYRSWIFGAAAAIGLAAASARAQDASWIECTPATSPSPRASFGLAYDEARRVAVLFGGITTVGSDYLLLGDTWTYDGVAWARMTSLQSPSPRGGHVMTYDSARKRVVLFGGLDDVEDLHAARDTWEWNGSTWTPAAPADSPRARASAGYAYDATRRTTIVFGGTTASSEILGDMWEWNGSNWLELPSPFPPSPRFIPSLAYDSARRRLVLQGGADPFVLSDTWEWDGAGWTERVPATHPGTRVNAAMIYDPGSKRCVLFGGGASDTNVWTWDGTDWSSLTIDPAPEDRNGHKAVYDSALGRLVLFGGFDGTSEFFGDTWHLVSSGFSGSVNGASGSPSPVLFVNGLTSDDACAAPVTVPRGSPIEIRLDASPAGPDPSRYVLWVWQGGPVRPIALRFGASTLGTLANPTPFQPFASPQPMRCLNGGLSSVFCTDVGGVASPPSAPFRIERARGLSAPAVFTLQGLLEDAGAANATGFSATNAVILRIF